MIFHYAGKYDGDENHLPQREHHPDCHPFKEPESTAKLSKVANIGCIVTMLVLAVPLVLLGWPYLHKNTVWLIVGSISSMLTMFPHEFLHALCYKKDVYMYNDLSQGLMFVVGTEDMSKARFIFMCLLPNIVFGFVPYIVFLVFPKLVGFGAFGLICIGMGFGDYMNVYNALRQMPKHSKTYLNGMHSYWYKD